MNLAELVADAVMELKRVPDIVKAKLDSFYKEVKTKKLVIVDATGNGREAVHKYNQTTYTADNGSKMNVNFFDSGEGYEIEIIDKDGKQVGSRLKSTSDGRVSLGGKTIVTRGETGFFDNPNEANSYISEENIFGDTNASALGIDIRSVRIGDIILLNFGLVVGGFDTVTFPTDTGMSFKYDLLRRLKTVYPTLKKFDYSPRGGAIFELTNSDGIRLDSTSSQIYYRLDAETGLLQLSGKDFGTVKNGTDGTKDAENFVVRIGAMIINASFEDY